MNSIKIDLDDNALAQAKRGRRIAAAHELSERAVRGELDAGIHAYEARKAAQRAAALELTRTGDGAE